jgi:hypothetical protein
MTGMCMLKSKPLTTSSACFWLTSFCRLLKRTTFSDSCRSWYKSGKTEGRVTAAYLGSMVHFLEFLERVRGEDFDIVYRSVNRFRMLGDGWTKREKNNEDLAWWME